MQTPTALSRFVAVIGSVSLGVLLRWPVKLREFFARKRHSAQWRLATRLSFGALVLIVAATVLGNIAEDVATNDSIVQLDLQVAQWFHQHMTPALTTVMLAITNLHGTLAVSLAVVFLLAWLAWKRDWYWLLCTGLIIPGGVLLNVCMKYAFQRSRPSFANQLLELTTYSFPSGHVAGATLLYGVLIAMLLSRTRSMGVRVTLMLLACSAVILVAVTRMYLGVHYLTDVLAAFAESIAWLALCLTSVHAYWARRFSARLRAPLNPGN